MAKNTNVLVNEEKARRAQDIFGLVSGKVAPKDQMEIERKDRWTRHLAAGEIGLDDEQVATEFIYEKLGGLIRTPADQAKADRRKEEIKKAKKVDTMKVR